MRSGNEAPPWHAAPGASRSGTTEFELVEPLRIPGGSTLIVEGHYDNSYRNRYNPAPQKEVYWGEQSWDEMFEGWIKYSIDSQDLTAAVTTDGQEE